MILQMYSL